MHAIRFREFGTQVVHNVVVPPKTPSQQKTTRKKTPLNNSMDAEKKLAELIRALIVVRKDYEPSEITVGMLEAQMEKQKLDRCRRG